jgi:hypothetical protein
MLRRCRDHLLYGFTPQREGDPDTPDDEAFDDVLEHTLRRIFAVEISKRQQMRIHRRAQAVGSDRSVGPVHRGQTGRSMQRTMSKGLPLCRGHVFSADVP